MRRYLSVLALMSAFVLTGIGHHRPAPTAAPAPTPTPTPTAAPTPALPSVIIYPFQVNGDADKQAGVKMVSLMTSQMLATGGVIVKPPSVALVQRADYLTNALKNGADYYISGYLTPVGEEVNLVEQVVSTTSGAIIWSNTAQILTYGDAVTQAIYMDKAIINHSGRVEAEYRQQTALATPTPGPANGTQTSIGRILGLLHHGGSAASRETVAADKKPARPVLVVGSGESARLLQTALDRAYNVTKSATLSSNVARDAKAICGVTTNASIASGELSTRVIKGFPASRTEYTFNLNVHRCDGTVFFTHRSTGGSAEAAVDGAVDAFIGAHPSNS